jgi:hypothetical protein
VPPSRGEQYSPERQVPPQQGSPSAPQEDEGEGEGEWDGEAEGDGEGLGEVLGQVLQQCFPEAQEPLAAHMPSSAQEIPLMQEAEQV